MSCSIDNQTSHSFSYKIKQPGCVRSGPINSGIASYEVGEIQFVSNLNGMSGGGYLQEGGRYALRATSSGNGFVLAPR